MFDPMGRIWLVLMLLGGIPCLALNPSKALSQYSRTQWTQQHGLPQDTVRALAQTDDGYLWIGTDEGLVRFDGYEFVVFNRDRTQLPSNSITALCVGRDGSLWIGTPNGLVEYRGGVFRTYTHAHGLPDDAIGSIVVDHTGAIWAVAGGDLSRLDRTSDGKGTFTNFLRERDLPMKTVRYVTEDTHNIIYVAGNNAVARFEQGKFVDVFPPAMLKDAFPAGVHGDSHGNLWIIGATGLIERTADGRVKRFGAREGLSDSFGVFAFWEDRDGNIWVGTDTGVARLEGERFNRWIAPGSERGFVLCLYEDREGNLWAGGDKGLTRLRDDVFTVYGKNEGLPSDQPNAIFRDHTGTTWIGFLDHGPVPFTAGMKPAAAVPTTTQDFVYSIRETRKGELLVSGRVGLTRIKDGKARLFVPPDPFGRKRVYDALEDSTGRIWLALPGGLATLTGEHFETVIRAGPVMLQDSFVTLAEAGGSIWAGTMRKGLWHVSANETKQYTQADGLGSDQIRALYPDPDGTLWIGTLGGGLNFFKGEKFSAFRTKDGLLSDNVGSLTDDGESLWLSTPRGISRVSKQQLYELASRTRSSVRPQNFGVTDGLRSSQSSSELGNGGVRQPDGTLWFVTNHGIAVLGPRAHGRPEPPPVLHLLRMTTGEGKALDLTRTPQIPPGSGRLEISYAGIHLGAPERVRYAYKLEGLDSDWVQAEGRRNVTYDNLRHGQYRFLVRAELPGGPSSQVGYELEMLPRFYETTQFRLLMLVLLAGAVWGAYKLRVRQVRSRFDLILHERARLAREVHDTLAQGFVGIASQLDVVEMWIPESESEARGALALARRMAHHSLTEARRSVVDLRAAALDDEDLAAALRSGIDLWTAGSGAQAHVAVEGATEDLPEETAHQVLRIAQEAVTNAAKHAHPAHISVALKREPKTLALAVEDDGRGFDPDTVFELSNGNFGLLGMRERAERVGGDLRLTSRAGRGTRVAVTVPLP